MKKNKLQIIAEILFQPETLAKVFMFWLVITFMASAIAISFVANTPVIASNAIDVAEIVNETNNWVPPANTQKIETRATTTIESSIKTVKMGGALPVRLMIDSLGIDVTVVNPVSDDIEVLDKELLNGIVRHPASGLLGEKDRNILLFGHSSHIPFYQGLWRAFNDIEKMNDGEVIALQSGDQEYVYRVSRVYKKSATDGVINLDGKNNMLTLVTCDTLGKKSDRWVVEADFIGTYVIDK